MRIHDDLKQKYNDKAGHLEKAEYYCHIHGTKMREAETEQFKCSHNECKNEYNTSMYRHKRTNRKFNISKYNSDDLP